MSDNDHWDKGLSPITHSVADNFKRLFEYRERLQEKLVTELYQKTLSDHPKMDKTKALVYAAEAVREKIAGIKRQYEEDIKPWKELQ
jgi:hypothetical protein